MIDDGFWPMQEPLKMADGNWIMSGIHVGDGNPAAVAVSRGDDLTKWEQVRIPEAGASEHVGRVDRDGRRPARA